MKEELEWQKELRQIKKNYISEVIAQTPPNQLPDTLVDSLMLSAELDRAAEWFQKHSERGKDWYRIDNYKRHKVALQTYISLIHPEKGWTCCYSGKIKPNSENPEEFDFLKREVWLVNTEKYGEWAKAMTSEDETRGIEIPGMTVKYKNGKVDIVFHRK